MRLIPFSTVAVYVSIQEDRFDKLLQIREKDKLFHLFQFSVFTRFIEEKAQATKVPGGDTAD